MRPPEVIAVTDAGDVDQVAAVAWSLRALLASIDAGKVEASDVQRAYVAGAVDVLDALAGRGT